jgi:hypothetical protein
MAVTGDPKTRKRKAEQKADWRPWATVRAVFDELPNDLLVDLFKLHKVPMRFITENKGLPTERKVRMFNLTAVKLLRETQDINQGRRLQEAWNALDDGSLGI